MRVPSAIAITLGLLAAAPAAAQSIQITPIEARPSQIGPSQTFTGRVVVDHLVPATDHTRATSAHVTFAPGARSAWHTHPAGQFLIVTSGTGWVQEWGGERRRIKAGDVVWTPPGVKHWHGATETNGMSHIALQELVDGENVRWMEHVTDEQFHGDRRQ
jgi:quercetin dioxygenase-like cupin family protein